MKKWRNKILSAVLTLSLLLITTSFAFAVGEEGSDNYELITNEEIVSKIPSSIQNGYGIDKAFNGNVNDYWHTNWTATNDTTASTGLNRSVMLTFNEVKPIAKISYTPRIDNGGGATNGRFEDCVVFADKDNDGNIDVSENSTDIVGNWHFNNNNTEKEMSFDTTVVTNKIIIYAKNTYGDNGSCDNRFANAAEIKLYKDMSKYPTITEQPVSAIGNSVTLNVSATASNGSSLTYQWYRYTTNISEATEVQGETNSSITITPTNTLTYYYVKVSQTIDGNTVSINSDPAYVKSPDTTTNLTQINKDNGLSIYDYSSEANNSDVDRTIDKDTSGAASKFWETKWDGSDTELYVTFDLGATYNLAKVKYYKRQDVNNGVVSYNGTPRNLEIWTSVDGNNWSLVKVQPIEKDLSNQGKEIIFEENVQARYVKFHPKDNDVYKDGDNVSFSVAEAEFFVDLSSETLITQQPVLDENGQITIGTVADANIQWYKNSTATYDDAQTVGYTANSFTPSKEESAYYFAKVTKGTNSVYSGMVSVQSAEAMIERENGNFYGSFTDAIEEAVAGEEIKVLRDIELTSGVNIDKELTIIGTSFDEARITIKRASGNIGAMFSINNTGNLTFNNIVIDGGAQWAENGPAVGKTTNTGLTAENAIVLLTNANGGRFTLGEDAVLQNNQNISGAGGGVRADTKNVNPVITINGTIKNCASTGDSYPNGGGVAASCTVIINSTANFSYNYSQGAANEDGGGGAVQIYNVGLLQVNGGTFENNSSAKNGGAIFFGSTNATASSYITNATFTNNNAANGGAVHTNNLASSLNISESTFTNNTATNGGAIYIGGGTISLGDNTSFNNNDATSNGNAIHYGNGTLNITGNAVFGDGQIIYRINSKNVNVNTDFSGYSGKIYVKPGNISAGSQIGTLGTNGVAETAVKVLTVKNDDNNDYTTYCMDNAIKYGDKATYTKNLDSEKSVMVDPTTSTASTTLSVAATGSNVSYKWYSCNSDGTNPQLLDNQTNASLTLTDLTNGSTYYYCVIDNGDVSSNDPVQSITCEVKVSDFYPCSQAISKFKGI